MSIKALQDYTFTSKYAKYLKDKKRRENWNESVNRVKQMMLKKYADIPAVHEDIEYAYDMMRKKRVLGSQRALQFGGDPILRKNMRIYNCTSSYCDRLRFFQEAMWLLLCGTGVGFSIQQHHIDKLPRLIAEKEDVYKRFVVEDTIEGWSDAIGVLVSSYFKQKELFPEYTGLRITFDFSKIRPEGSDLSYGGKAPGPEPLKYALSKIKQLLDGVISNKQKQLRPIQAYDIVMHSSDAVLSGGVRRSATICLFSFADEEMMKAKTGNWFNENPQRGRSNNSVVLKKDEVTEEQFSTIIKNIAEFGEPGYLFVYDYEHLLNPCVTGDTLLKTIDGDIAIQDLVDKEVIIWNGYENSKVIPKITGYNQSVLKISTSLGSSIKCTHYHEFIEYGTNQRIQAKDLKVGTKLNGLVMDYRTTSDNCHHIVSLVEDAGIADIVYCVNEPKRHQAVFNTIVTGNCAEISFYAYNEKGESGFQACNLSTINCGKVKTEQDFYESCKAAAIIGTLQAGFTNTDYLGKVSQEIIEREALLGVSMTGMMDSPHICLNPDIQRHGANIVKDTNAIIAKKIGINQAARTTCVKPEGTSSCVLGTSSGIHPHHAKRYIRRVQANRLEDVYQFFKKSNPRACEESVWSANDTDEVASFCISVQDGAKTKNKLDAIDLLKYVQSTQINWVQTGTNKDLCTRDWLVHNVSNTISVKPDEWDTVRDFIYENREDFCGITLLPVTGDKDYPQAPFTSIYLPEEMIKFYGDGAIFVSGLIEQALSLFEDNLWKASEYLLGVLNVKGSSKKEWVDRCKKFAGKYFDNDLRRLSYCMKDVYNYKLWTELNQEYQEIDWDMLYEEDDNTKVNQELACVGGACLI